MSFEFEHSVFECRARSVVGGWARCPVPNARCPRSMSRAVGVSGGVEWKGCLLSCTLCVLFKELLVGSRTRSLAPRRPCPGR